VKRGEEMKSKKQKRIEAEERQKKYDELSFDEKLKKAGKKQKAKLLLKRNKIIEIEAEGIGGIHV